MKTKIILPMFLFNMLSGIGAGVMALYSGWQPIWIGVFLATFPLPFFLLVLTQILGISRTSEKLPLIQLINFIGLGLTAYSYFKFYLSGIMVIPVLVAILGFISLHWYIWSFSYYNREKSRAIVNGEVLPEMKFKKLNKEEISSNSFKDAKTLMVFFRANWCPFCMNQLKEVIKHSASLSKAGVQVKFISNQGFKHNQELADKLQLPSHFEILQDEDLKGARVLGIEDIDGSPVGMPGFPKDTVMATVIALDKDGKVLFGDETDNYRRRPNPSTFLHVFQ